MRTHKIKLLLVGLLLLASNFAFSQAVTPNSPQNVGWVSQLDTYAKIFAAIVASLGTLFGLPITIITFKKTKAEIRKLELEASLLVDKSANDISETSANRSTIDNSHDVNIQILADPRYLGPLLLLLDFIIAWIFIMLADYAVSIIMHGILHTLTIGVFSAIVLIPIAREARRVRDLLRQKLPAISQDAAPIPKDSEHA